MAVLLTQAEIKKLVEDMVAPLPSICKIQSPFGYLCLAALIDYCATAAYKTLPGFGNVGPRYIRFIEEFMPAYKAFVYPSGKDDLPRQMYYLLRNGLVHNFSLVPTNKSARERAIILAHQENAGANQHLDSRHATKGGKTYEVAYFVAEDFCQDTVAAAFAVIDPAHPMGRRYWPKVQQHFSDHPPISWQGSI